MSIVLAFGLMIPPFARAGPADTLVDGYLANLGDLENSINSQDDLLQLIIDANRANDALDEKAISALDERWIEGDEEIRQPVLSNPLTLYLKTRIEAAGGRIGEIIIMDDKGLTVAAWPATSDYLQGDEDKFLQTYDRGSDDAHVSRVDFDESTGLFEQQISKILKLRGRRIGAITLGIDIAYAPPK